MLKYLLFFILFSLKLFSDAYLQESYYVKSDDIKLSDIVSNVKDDATLYSIQTGKYTKRVKSKELIALLKKHGFKEYDSKHHYVKFIKKSPIDVSKIKKNVLSYYEKIYKDIKINGVEVNYRGYIQTLPENYSVHMQSKNYLRRDGTVFIKSDTNKELFFDFKIDALIHVYRARNDIKKDAELSSLNIIKKSIILDKFNAMPLQELKKATVQSKHNIQKDAILTTRDVEKLYLVKRGSNINVVLDSSNLSISFTAKALDNGCYGEFIRVEKSDGTRIRVKVTKKQSGEVK